MNVLVIGESCRDIYRYGECSRLCPEAPVPVIKLSNEEYSINPGMAMNVYRNIASLSDGTIETAISTNANWESVNKVRYVDQYISRKHKNTLLDTKKILGDWCSDIKYIKINEFEYNRTKHMLDENMNSKMIITLGPNGAKHLDKTYSVPKVEIKDTSGAGDTFIAALALKYAQTKDIEESIEFANRNATLVVQKKGVSVV